MRYIVKGFHRETGEAVEMTIDASSEDDAVHKAGDRGVVVETANRRSLRYPRRLRLMIAVIVAITIIVTVLFLSSSDINDPEYVLRSYITANSVSERLKYCYLDYVSVDQFRQWYSRTAFGGSTIERIDKIDDNTFRVIGADSDITQSIN